MYREGQAEQFLEAIDSATDETTPELTALVSHAFEGDAGLQALRSEHVSPLITKGLAHHLPQVRAATVSQLQRLVSCERDAELLVHRNWLQLLAKAVGDSSLLVAQRASALFVASSAAGVAVLRIVLADA